ncbi:MAG TPA: HPr family phosphocarrier protein [Clostridiaceae bacterium]|nr:HPr family phosphocarrier protein [Clostridiaceae bacterium]
MLRENVIFHCKEETLMKAVAMLIQISSGFNASIYIAKDGRRANAKSLLGVLSLGISDGDHLEISADGDDGSSALYELASYMGPSLS